MNGGLGSRLAPASFGATGWAMAFTALIFVVDGTQTGRATRFAYDIEGIASVVI
jgi:hypothetical protein